MSALVGVHREHVGGLSHPASPQCPPLAEPGCGAAGKAETRLLSQLQSAPQRTGEAGWSSAAQGGVRCHCCWSQVRHHPLIPVPLSVLWKSCLRHVVFRKPFSLPFSCRILIRRSSNSQDSEYKVKAGMPLITTMVPVKARVR